MALALVHPTSDLQSPSRDDLLERCFRASEILWQIDDCLVVVPASENQPTHRLRNILNALGVTVLSGAGDLPCRAPDAGEDNPLIVADATEWRSAAGRSRIDGVRQALGGAKVCVVTGFLALPDPSFAPATPVFNDARALLQAAGIGFFCIEGQPDGHPAQRT